jgi:fumarylacetoacetate (FAA) hydrolase family protein
MAYPPAPLLFSKFNNTLAGHGEDVPLPSKSSQVDNEAELVVVIGKEAKDVKKEDALSYVYGYCNADDLSARDLQFKSSQWLLGKTCDKFSPIGSVGLLVDCGNKWMSIRSILLATGKLQSHSGHAPDKLQCIHRSGDSTLQMLIPPY